MFQKSKGFNLIELIIFITILVGIAATTKLALENQNLEKYAMVDPGGGGGIPAPINNPNPPPIIGDNTRNCDNANCSSNERCVATKEGGYCVSINDPPPQMIDPHVANLPPKFQDPNSDGKPGCVAEIQVVDSCIYLHIPLVDDSFCSSKCVILNEESGVAIIGLPTPKPVENIIGEESGEGFNNFLNGFPGGLNIGGANPNPVILPQNSNSVSGENPVENKPSLFENIKDFFSSLF